MGEPIPLLIPSLIFSLLSLSNTFTALTSATSNATDQRALLAFKSLVTHDPSSSLSSWGANQTLHLCQWPGVTCDSPRHPERVTSLMLDSLGLVGSLSPSLSNLSFLRVLYLPNNRFSGSLPSELGLLSRLRALVLSNNSLSGEIPTNISSCRRLSALFLDTNSLSGPVPPVLGSLSSLSKLHLYDNSLTGRLPAAIGNLSLIESLDLSGNGLEGEIPDSLGRLTSLVYLQLSINRLSGELPPLLCNSSSVYKIDVGANELYGALPMGIGSRLPNMRKLYLYSNRFEGSIPISLSNASRLERLGLENNYCTGVVPWELGAVRSMSWLALGNNSLEAKESGDWGFVDFLTNCSNLQVFDISHNMFGGMLPISIGNLSTQLQWLSMEGNKITGTIPAEIGRYVNLTFLSMFDNLLMGSIPTTIGKLESLNQLRLFGNGFSGEIPSSLGNLTQLVELNLGGNFLEGSIPSSLGRLASLNLLNLSCNMLVGSIPKEIVSLSSLTRYLDISRNSLTGPLPGELGSLKNLVGLNVSENKLSGEIPSSIGECQVLGYLLMEGNYLQGAIPSTLRNLRGIQDLDLSRNNLSGEFPDFLESFKYLQYLNLSFNDLEGQVPTGGIFQNLSSFSLIGNTQLCGGDKELHLQECPTETSKQRHSSPSVKLIASVVGGVVGFFLLFSFIAFVYWVKFPRTDFLIRTSSIDEHSRVSYAQLVKATDAFSSANLIGAGSFGSVYKGILSSDEKVIAVKVFNLQQRGGSRSFMAECEALRNTRHRNLVKILSSCSSTDSDGNEFKALIYEFMPNGSLEEWLHPESSSMNLDFIQRWNIAIDVASALDYLHHYGHTPIVHCDLKPNNILLDEDMVTRVSDFGLARFIHTAAQGISEIPFSSRGLKGSIGYIAPEYGIHGQISTHGDAYSYGILLLEMFTGKRPTDDAFKDGLSLRKSVEMVFPERVMDIIDPRLILDNNNHNKSTNNAAGKLHKYMLLVIGVALSCSKDSPRERREMGQVVKEMLAARDMFLGEFISKQDFIKE